MLISRTRLEVEDVEMLTSYPIKINDTAIPFPDSWEETPKKLASEYETEDGHRIKNVIRVSRHSISASFTVSSSWLKKFMLWRASNSVTVKVYDPSNNGYQSHTMDIADDSFTYELIKGSKRLRNTNGLYRLSFTLEEF